MDKDRNAVSLITSISDVFGSGLIVPGAGIVLHNRGADFELEDDHPNVAAPGKRVRHTILPAMLLDPAGEFTMTFGCMGANMQPQGQVQILVNLLDRGMNLQEALDAPACAFSMAGASRRRHTQIRGSPTSSRPWAIRFRWETRFHRIGRRRTTSCGPSRAARKPSRFPDPRFAELPIHAWTASPSAIERNASRLRPRLQQGRSTRRCPRPTHPALSRLLAHDLGHAALSRRAIRQLDICRRPFRRWAGRRHQLPSHRRRSVLAQVRGDLLRRRTVRASRRAVRILSKCRGAHGWHPQECGQKERRQDLFHRVLAVSSRASEMVPAERSTKKPGSHTRPLRLHTEASPAALVAAAEDTSF